MMDCLLKNATNFIFTKSNAMVNNNGASDRSSKTHPNSSITSPTTRLNTCGDQPACCFLLEFPESETKDIINLCSNLIKEKEYTNRLDTILYYNVMNIKRESTDNNNGNSRYAFVQTASVKDPKTFLNWIHYTGMSVRLCQPSIVISSITKKLSHNCGTIQTEGTYSGNPLQA